MVCCRTRPLSQRPSWRQHPRTTRHHRGATLQRPHRRPTDRLQHNRRPTRQPPLPRTSHHQHGAGHSDAVLLAHLASNLPTALPPMAPTWAIPLLTASSAQRELEDHAHGVTPPELLNQPDQEKKTARLSTGYRLPSTPPVRGKSSRRSSASGTRRSPQLRGSPPLITTTRPRATTAQPPKTPDKGAATAHLQPERGARNGKPPSRLTRRHTCASGATTRS